MSQLSTEALQINGLKKVKEERETHVQRSSHHAGPAACLLVVVDIFPGVPSSPG